MLLLPGSHLSVSASPEDCKKFACSGRWLHGNVSVYGALLVRRWKKSNIFYVKGISDAFHVQVHSDPADVAVFLHRQVPAVLSGAQTVQKVVEIPQVLGGRRPCDHAATSGGASDQLIDKLMSVCWRL